MDRELQMKILMFTVSAGNGHNSTAKKKKKKILTNNPEAEMFVMKGGTYAGQIPNAVATGVCMKGTQPIPDYIKPGHGSVHQPDEMLPIDGYIEGIKLLATMILKVDEVL